MIKLMSLIESFIPTHKRWWMDPDGEVTSVPDHILWALEHIKGLPYYLDYGGYPVDHNGMMVDETDVYAACYKKGWLRLTKEWTGNDVYVDHLRHQQINYKQATALRDLSIEYNVDLVDAITQRTIFHAD